MREIKSSKRIFDQFYMIYTHNEIPTRLTFIKYAGIFTELLLQDNGSWSSDKYSIDKFREDFRGRWFKLTKDEVIKHIILEKIAENI